MKKSSLIIYTILFSGFSFSQNLNFDKVGLYDNIKEINNYEVIHNANTNDTNQLGYYTYNKRGDITEKRYNYRLTQSRRRKEGDKGEKFLYIDTVGTKKNPAFTKIIYQYNNKGYLVNKIHINTEPLFLVNQFTKIDSIVSVCNKFNINGLHTSSVITFHNGEIETHYYDYEKKFVKEKRIYRNEQLFKTIIFDYKYYFEE